MGDVSVQPEWYYVGHYGQLGPLTFEQITELANDGVIAHDTYVWRPGMGDWRPAQDVQDLRTCFVTVSSEFMPPPVPTATKGAVQPMSASQYSTGNSALAQGSWSYLQSNVPVSDKNRVTAGLLNLLPGFGRFYLGYAAHGALQLLTTLFCGIGILWSIIDGIYILMGGVKYDGYGRVLQD